MGKAKRKAALNLAARAWRPRGDQGVQRTEAARRVASPWRGWYATARWKKLREQVIERDKGICQQTGKLLIGKAPEPDSPVVDHIRPHRGDPDLFWDIDNLQLVSKAWHDSEKQRLERAGRV